MNKIMVDDIAVYVPNDLKINGKAVDIQKIIRDKAKYVTYRGKLVEAKIRIYSNQEADPEDLSGYLDQFLDWNVRKIGLNTFSPLVTSNVIEIDDIKLVKYSYFSYTARTNILEYLKSKSLRKVIELLDKLPTKPCGVDMIALMTLSNPDSKEVVTFGCSGDCRLTFQGASEDSRFIDFIKYWEDKIILLIGVCGKLEIEKKIEKTKVVSVDKTKEITGWACF